MQSTEVAPDMLGRQIDRPVPLRERVYEAMQELIISGSLAPGQHLVESELAAMLGVSRQPIREALQLLNSDGWVDLKPGYGAFVHAPTDQEVDQLLAVRSVLEGESARVAAQVADSDGIARLHELCDEGEAAIAADDIDRMVTANAELHRYVTQLSDNKVLLDFVTQVDRRVRWYYTPIARQRGVHSWREHRRLIEAIENRDSDLASQIMREHTERTRLSYLEQIESEPENKSPAVPPRRRRRAAPRS